MLDRFFVSVDWLDQYLDVVVKHLSSYGSDHNSLILSIGDTDLPRSQFRFEPEWLKIESFVQLLKTWWNDIPLSDFRMGLAWHNKTKKLKQKIQGWTRNYYGEKERYKQAILDQLSSLELIRNDRELDTNEFQQWIHLKNQLDIIYLEEEQY